MAATQGTVDAYIVAIRAELTTYGDKLATMAQYGHKPSFAKELKFMLLEAFVTIAEWYLDEWNDTANNEFTIAEFEDIQQHINKIANSSLWLEMN